MIRRIFVLALLVPILSWGAENPHKIVYLISGPRALSTVFLRMMESRGDFAIYHEPTIPPYDRIYYKKLTKDWFCKDAFITFDEVKQAIFESQKNSKVFIKDMSFSSHEFILKDPEFMENASIHFLFLVRNPHHTSISFYQRTNDIIERMSDLIGLRKLYEEYETIKKHSPNAVKIIFSEELYNHPRLTMTALCQHLEIPFSEAAFEWKQYGQDFQGAAEWNEQKEGNHIHHWHGRAIQSGKIEKPSSYEVDDQDNPTFSEIANESHKVQLIEAYLENLVYYHKFLEAKEDHLDLALE